MAPVLSPEIQLPRFLEEQARLPFRLGERDCVLMLADWMVVLGAPDPAGDLRGTYATEAQWRAASLREGGLAWCVRARVRRAGWRWGAERRPGAVGLGHVGEGLTGLISTYDGRAATRGEDGVHLLRVDSEIGWAAWAP